MGLNTEPDEQILGNYALDSGSPTLDFKYTQVQLPSYTQSQLPLHPGPVAPPIPRP